MRFGHTFPLLSAAMPASLSSHAQESGRFAASCGCHTFPRSAPRQVAACLLTCLLPHPARFAADLKHCTVPSQLLYHSAACPPAFGPSGRRLWFTAAVRQPKWEFPGNSFPTLLPSCPLPCPLLPRRRLLS